jgi:4,5-dihydroxyphthalate decarboxylase
MALQLTFACPPYDRILPVCDGRVSVEGARVNHLPMEVEEIFWRQLRNAEFGLSESSLSSYVMLRSRGMSASPPYRCSPRGSSGIHAFLSTATKESTRPRT